MYKKLLSTFIAVTQVLSSNGLNHTSSRGSKALSLFQVVRFPNTECFGSNLNGTCYTATECTNKGGVVAGSCANGFGVCCTFSLGCGGSSSENNTYFQSSATATLSGQCGMTICKCSSDICQLRLDFSSFVISGPNTFTQSSISTINGVFAPGGIASESLATQCMTDSFSVTGMSSSPPVICGTNSGYHMYVDASPSCNSLLFQLGPIGVGTNLVNRQWSIKISQVSCYSLSLPPQGCTQYYTGVSNYFNSYNYAGGVQLANQNQHICFRRERGFCSLCISPSSVGATADFSVSGKQAFGFLNSRCCGYGVQGVDTMTGYDCLIIPNAVKAGGTSQLIGNQFCGRFLVTATNQASGKTICTNQQPFNIQFLTDSFTHAKGGFGTPATAGFRLIYYQNSC